MPSVRGDFLFFPDIPSVYIADGLIDISTFSNFLASLGEANGGWVVNHSGRKVKHDTAPVVPIQSAVLLFGSGLIGLIGFRRNFRTKYSHSSIRHSRRGQQVALPLFIPFDLCCLLNLNL